MASKALDCSGKGLSSLPDAVRTVGPVLQSLDASDNKLTELDADLIGARRRPLTPRQSPPPLRGPTFFRAQPP